MYEREERLIEQAGRLAAEATDDPARAAAGDAATLNAIRRPIGTRESALGVLSLIYLWPGGPADAPARPDEFLMRTWSALLSVEWSKTLP